MIEKITAYEVDGALETSPERAAARQLFAALNDACIDLVAAATMVRRRERVIELLQEADAFIKQESGE